MELVISRERSLFHSHLETRPHCPNLRKENYAPKGLDLLAHDGFGESIFFLGQNLGRLRLCVFPSSEFPILLTGSSHLSKGFQTNPVQGGQKCDGKSQVSGPYQGENVHNLWEGLKNILRIFGTFFNLMLISTRNVSLPHSFCVLHKFH